MATHAHGVGALRMCACELPAHRMCCSHAVHAPGQARPGQRLSRQEAPGLAQVAGGGGVSLPAAAYPGCSSVQPGPRATGWQLLHPAASARAVAPPSPCPNKQGPTVHRLTSTTHTYYALIATTDTTTATRGHASLTFLRSVRPGTTPLNKAHSISCCTCKTANTQSLL